jgi:hypothetical protein
MVKGSKPIWHTYNKTVYHYPSQKVVFDGLVIRGNFTSASRCCGDGVWFEDYSAKNIVIRNSDIQGMEMGIKGPSSGFGPGPNLTVENTVLRNWTNLGVPTPSSVNGCWMENKLIEVRNSTFFAPPGRSLSAINMSGRANGTECLSKLNEVRVYGYNGNSADNFQVYHPNTAVLPRPPADCVTSTRTGINGPTCAIGAPVPGLPTVTLAAAPASIIAGQSSTLSWSSSGATTVSINQGVGLVAASGTRAVTPSVNTTYTITATNTVGSVTASATVAVAAPTPAPTITLTATPGTIAAGGSATLSWTSANATTVSINQNIGNVSTSGSLQVSPSVSTTYTATASGNGGTAAASFTVTVTTTTSGPHTNARANAYDDEWQDGPEGWVAHARSILANGSGQVPGLVLWIGDSLTRDPALGAWAQRGTGKTADDQAITAWMNAGASPQGVDSIDGFALATPYICPARSFTVGDGLGSWHFMRSSMPTDTNPVTAREKLLDCASYPNALNLRTMLAGLPKAQFAIPEVNLDAANPGAFPDLEAMVDLMISEGIVPIILTYTYRTDAAFNQMVDQYNAALVQYARTKKLPLIDFNNEMLERLPFSQWPGRFLADGVHYTRGNSSYPATSNPYADGGDAATHATGLALTYNGYGLKGWLGVQKMKEIKALVVDTLPAPLPLPLPTVTLSASSSSIEQGASVTLTWSSANAASVAIAPAVGAVAQAGSIQLSPPSTITYTVTATNATGSATAQVTVMVTAPPPPEPIPAPAALLSPAPGSVLGGTTQTFAWSAGTSVTEYKLDVGTSIGGSDLYAGAATTALSATVGNLPSTGVKVWVRLSSRIYGAWQSVDASFTSYTQSAILVRQTVSINGTGVVRTPAISTQLSNELLVAFASSSGPGTSRQQVTITGGGLTWRRAMLANAQRGSAEVWWARVVNPTANIVVTATQTSGGYDQSLIVVRFSGATGVGNAVQHNAIDEAPRVTLTTTRANSLVFGVANDSYSATARTIPAGQVMVHEWLDTRIADAFWVQTFAAPIARAGTTVRLNVTEPVRSRWNFAAIEIVR